MNRADVIARLKHLEPELRSRGVAALYLYGSHARDEAQPESDIDILVDFEAGGDVDLAASLAPYALLQDRFPGAEIGYGTRENIPPAFLPHVERGALRVF